jgi:hypothetical protein
MHIRFLVTNSVAVTASLFLLCASPASATPPEPPARLVLPEERVRDLRIEGGVVRLPLQIRPAETLTRVEIEARIIGGTTVEPITVGRGLVGIPEVPTQGQPIEVPIDLRAEPGTYRLEVELRVLVQDRPAIVDRLVLDFIVEREIVRLVPAGSRRRSEQRERNEAFRRRLGEAPDAPDVRLLDPTTTRLSNELAQRVAPGDPERGALGARSEGPDKAIKPFVQDRTGAAWTPTDPITVRGRIVYQDFEGTWRPLVNASVNLFDDDTFGDEHLGTTVTDWDGRWSFSVNNDDGIFQNGRDIYYRFNLGNARFDVRDDGGDQYRWQSSVHEDLNDGSIVDFGDETASSDMAALQVFGFLNLGWNHITTAGGRDPGFIASRYPMTNSRWLPGAERLEIATADNDSPDTVLHEYGHGLMFRAFGGSNGSPGGSHGFGDDNQDPRLSWSEGWATGFMLSLCPDGAYNWHEGSAEGAGEWPACQIQNDGGQAIERFSDPGNRVGENNEGRVAAALNDFLDGPDDDNGGSEDAGRNGERDANNGNRIGLATIYRDTMWGETFPTFLDFWRAFAGELSGTPLTLAGDIMRYNWMSLPLDIDCAANSIVVAERRDATQTLTDLRRFRDLAFKPLQIGRGLIGTYYRHSPELAMLLLQDSDARAAALRVVDHGAELGRTLGAHRRLERALLGGMPVLPRDVVDAIVRVTKLIEARGSEDLRRDTRQLRDLIEPLEGLNLKDALEIASTLTPAEKGATMRVIERRAAAEGTQRPVINWQRIREVLPPALRP